MILYLIVYAYKINSYLFSPAVSTCFISIKYLPQNSSLLFLFPRKLYQDLVFHIRFLPSTPSAVTSAMEHQENLVHCPVLVIVLTYHGIIPCQDPGLSPGEEPPNSLQGLSMLQAFSGLRVQAHWTPIPSTSEKRERPSREPFSPLFQDLMFAPGLAY